MNPCSLEVRDGPRLTEPLEGPFCFVMPITNFTGYSDQSQEGERECLNEHPLKGTEGLNIKQDQRRLQFPKSNNF